MLLHDTSIAFSQLAQSHVDGSVVGMIAIVMTLALGLFVKILADNN